MIRAPFVEARGEGGEEKGGEGDRGGIRKGVKQGEQMEDSVANQLEGRPT